MALLKYYGNIGLSALESNFSSLRLLEAQETNPQLCRSKYCVYMSRPAIASSCANLPGVYIRRDEHSFIFREREDNYKGQRRGNFMRAVIGTKSGVSAMAPSSTDVATVVLIPPQVIS